MSYSTGELKGLDFEILEADVHTMHYSHIRSHLHHTVGTEPRNRHHLHHQNQQTFSILTPDRLFDNKSIYSNQNVTEQHTPKKLRYILKYDRQ
jgi:hypothetical protein